MFAKIFGQIFDSSIAENYTTRHVFMDLLVLADAEGAVDMTVEAVSRRTNVPLEIVRKAITELLEPDHASRSKELDGRRLEPLEAHRAWGWKIVNYAHYRAILDEDARRSYFRDYRRRERAAKKEGVQSVQRVQGRSPKVTQEDAEVTSTTTTAPATLEAAKNFAGGSVTIIPPEAVEAWHNDRTAIGWVLVKKGTEILIKDWQSDLRTFARHWNAHNARKPNGNHAPPAEKPKPKPQIPPPPANWRQLYKAEVRREYTNLFADGDDMDEWREIWKLERETARAIIARVNA